MKTYGTEIIFNIKQTRAAQNKTKIVRVPASSL